MGHGASQSPTIIITYTQSGMSQSIKNIYCCFSAQKVANCSLYKALFPEQKALWPDVFNFSVRVLVQQESTSSGHGLSQAFHPAGPECATLGLGFGALPGPSWTRGRREGRAYKWDENHTWGDKTRANRLSGRLQLYSGGDSDNKLHSGLCWSRPYRVPCRAVWQYPPALFTGLLHKCTLTDIKFGPFILYTVPFI